MHEYLDPASEEDEEEYWSFSTEDMGEDVYANVKAMYENSGTGKGWYFGSSQGTGTMQAALSKYDSDMSEYLNRAVLIAPCVWLGRENGEIDLSEENMNSIGWQRELGIYAINGPNWERDLAKICANRSEKECEQYSKKKGNAKSTKQQDHVKQQ